MIPAGLCGVHYCPKWNQRAQVLTSCCRLPQPCFVNLMYYRSSNFNAPCRWCFPVRRRQAPALARSKRRQPCQQRCLSASQ